jgi:hypothetical protein
MPDIENLPVTPEHLCPFLGTGYDAATYSTVSNRPNYCHKARPAAPVSIEQQFAVCTTDSFQVCPIYTAASPRRLPEEWVNRQFVEQNKGWFSRLRLWQVLALAGIILVIVILVVAATVSARHSATAANVATAKAAVSTSPVKKTTATPTLTHLPTRRPSATPTLTASATSTPAQFSTVQRLTDAELAKQTQSAYISPGDQTQTALVNFEGCSLSVSEPEFSPIKRDPPTYVGYGVQPFLIKWQVTNTSQNCKWLLVHLQTTMNGETKVLVPMTPGQAQPAIDSQFSMRDGNFALTNQVAPGQTVTIAIQIDGMEIIQNNGKIERTLNLLINGHLIAAPKLTASIEQWVIVDLETGTPSRTLVATQR